MTENLKDKRKIVNFTQSEIAKKLGTTKQMISYYEKINKIPLSLQAELEKIYGTKLEEFIERKAEISKYIEKEHITEEELANKIGVERKTIIRWIKINRIIKSPKYHELFKLIQNIKDEDKTTENNIEELRKELEDFKIIDQVKFKIIIKKYLNNCKQVYLSKHEITYQDIKRSYIYYAIKFQNNIKKDNELIFKEINVFEKWKK